MRGLVEFAALGIWGFLVGFVGWGGCLRLAEPIGDWLLSSKTKAPIVRGVARLLVQIFLIFAVLLVLALLPAVISSSAEDSNGGWRATLSITFLASFVGLFSLGVLRRLANK